MRIGILLWQMVLVDIAHLLMLKRQNVIDHENAAAIMTVLLGMQMTGVPEEAFFRTFLRIYMQASNPS